MAASYPIVIEPGTSWLLRIEWRDGDTPRNLAGYTFRAEFLRRRNVRMHAMTLSNGITVNAPAGQIELHIRPTDNGNWGEGGGEWWLRATDPAGDVWRIVGGPVVYGPAREAGDNAQLIIVDQEILRVMAVGVPADTGPDVDFNLLYQVAKL